MGFTDAARAERIISDDLALDADGADASLLAALGAAADPDLALAALARMPRDGALTGALREDAGLRARLTAVLGASTALGDHLARHPGDWHMLSGPDALRGASAGDLRAELLRAVGARPDDADPVADPAAAHGGDPATALPAAYRRRLLQLAARDLTGAVTVDETAAELADVAAAALEAALAIARSQLPDDAAPARLAVIAMGKCGGRELNYASDVDVIFVAAPVLARGDGPPDPPGISSRGDSLREPPGISWRGPRSARSRRAITAVPTASAQPHSISATHQIPTSLPAVRECRNATGQAR